MKHPYLWLFLWTYGHVIVISSCLFMIVTVLLSATTNYRILITTSGMYPFEFLLDIILLTTGLIAFLGTKIKRVKVRVVTPK